MIISVSDSGVQNLNKFADLLESSIVNIDLVTNSLVDTLSENKTGLGPHVSTIIDILKDIRSTRTQAASAASGLSEMLREVAAMYQSIIDNDLYSGSAQNSGADNCTVSDFAQSHTGSGASADTPVNSKEDLSANLQSTHKSKIADVTEAIAAVRHDILNGSGKIITDCEAETMLRSVGYYTGLFSGYIREAYNNPRAPKEDAEVLAAVDEYVRNAPKWEGGIYRGIKVTKKTAKKLLKQNTTDMLGPSSWSSDQSVAEGYAEPNKEKPVGIVYVLPRNINGVSVTHIATYNGAESEVLSPSGVIYHTDRVEKTVVNGRDMIYIYVHEQE